jgi:hypothetical protein
MAYTKPELRERIKNRVMAGTKGGKAGQWSARKAQIVAQEYKKAGGGYSGSKTSKQKSLSKWTKEKWGTKSGKPSTQGSKATGERYLPKAAREKLSASAKICAKANNFLSNQNLSQRKRQGIDNGNRHSR